MFGYSPGTKGANSSKFENLSFQSELETLTSDTDDNSCQKGPSFPRKIKRQTDDNSGRPISRWNVEFSGEGGLTLVDFF
jgi:hypothetical protein